MLKDKFNLTKEQNIFLAKKTIVENIYHTARLEGCNITFQDTKNILDGVSVGNLNMDDVQVVLNLHDAWRYALKHIDDPFSLEFACKINEHVARNESLDWGVLRYARCGELPSPFSVSTSALETSKAEVKTECIPAFGCGQ